MKLFELYSQRTARKSTVLKESIELCKSTIKLLEAGDLEWEPQPEFRGVQGTTTDTGTGIKASNAASQKQAAAKLNALWQKLLLRAKGMGREEKKKLVPHLKKLAAEADKRGFTLSPSPKDTLGLGTGGAAI